MSIYFTSFGEQERSAILTPHDGRRQFGKSGIRTCDHPHVSPELFHCAMDADKQILVFNFQKGFPRANISFACLRMKYFNRVHKEHCRTVTPIFLTCLYVYRFCIVLVFALHPINSRVIRLGKSILVMFFCSRLRSMAPIGRQGLAYKSRNIYGPQTSSVNETCISGLYTIHNDCKDLPDIEPHFFRLLERTEWRCENHDTNNNTLKPMYCKQRKPIDWLARLSTWPSLSCILQLCTDDQPN